MKTLTFDNPREALTHLLTRANNLIHYDQLAKAYYQYHVRRTRTYLWGSALLMVVALSCSAWLAFDGPKVLVVPAMVIPLMLLVLRIDRKVSFHLRASAEYLRSLADFEEFEGSDHLPEVLRTFELRCQVYGPSYNEAMLMAIALGWPTSKA
jgi:hypothetical protein